LEFFFSNPFFLRARPMRMRAPGWRLRLQEVVSDNRDNIWEEVRNWVAWDNGTGEKYVSSISSSAEQTRNCSLF